MSLLPLFPQFPESSACLSCLSAGAEAADPAFAPVAVDSDSAGSAADHPVVDPAADPGSGLDSDLAGPVADHPVVDLAADPDSDPVDPVPASLVEPDADFHGLYRCLGFGVRHSYSILWPVATAVD